MKSDFLINHFQNNTSITVEEFDRFKNYGTDRILKRNSMLLMQGDYSDIYFVKSGCLVTYFEDKNKYNHVLQFGMDGWWTGDLLSATKNLPAGYCIKALTDSAILQFSYETLEMIILEMPNFQKYFRYLFQNSLITQQRRIIDNISLPAEQRYESFLKIYPKSELIIPQKYIASYLGITPEFLSKMKSRLYNRLELV